MKLTICSSVLKNEKTFFSIGNETIEYLLEDPNIIINAIHEKEDESLRLIYHLQSQQDALDEQKVSNRGSNHNEKL